LRVLVVLKTVRRHWMLWNLFRKDRRQMSGKRFDTLHETVF